MKNFELKTFDRFKMLQSFHDKIIQYKIIYAKHEMIKLIIQSEMILKIVLRVWNYITIWIYNTVCIYNTTVGIYNTVSIDNTV